MKKYNTPLSSSCHNKSGKQTLISVAIATGAGILAAAGLYRLLRKRRQKANRSAIQDTDRELILFV